jgi:hypothetical protein
MWKKRKKAAIFTPRFSKSLTIAFSSFSLIKQLLNFYKLCLICVSDLIILFPPFPKIRSNTTLNLTEAVLALK